MDLIERTSEKISITMSTPTNQIELTIIPATTVVASSRSNTDTIQLSTIKTEETLSSSILTTTVVAIIRSNTDITPSSTVTTVSRLDISSSALSTKGVTATTSKISGVDMSVNTSTPLLNGQLIVVVSVVPAILVVIVLVIIICTSGLLIRRYVNTSTIFCFPIHTLIKI